MTKYKHGNNSTVIGLRFNRWTILQFSHRANRLVYYLCRCDCGTERPVRFQQVSSGTSQSCGCFADARFAKRNRTHGLSKSPIYDVWIAMKHRCSSPTNPNYHRYGGRDIRVCDRWLQSFENFLADMGKPEKGQSIERIDNDLGYYKENCKWASHSEQVRNRGNHRMITYAGRTQCCADWADEIGMIPDTFTGRLDDGWTVEEAITTPVMRKKW